MKTLLQTALTAAVITLVNASVVNAQLSETYMDGIGSETIHDASFMLIISPVVGTTLDISVDKKPLAHVVVQVRDDQRTTLFTSHSRTESPLFAQRLDLRELETGTYWLDVWVDKKRVTRRLQLTAINGDYQAVVLP